MPVQAPVTARYKIHPSIGIARLGNSDDFYIGPETLSGLPIACTAEGNTLPNPETGGEQTVENFRDQQGRIIRQAARFRIMMYLNGSSEGVELVCADPANKVTGTTVYGIEGSGELLSIQWVVWMANKKPSWYKWKELQGEHGYPSNAKLRNSDVDNRGALIVDPGPVILTGPTQKVELARGQNENYPQTFPPPLTPCSVDSLGTVLTDSSSRLLVVGAYGNSGSLNTGLGEPQITHYANNDGWFDDIADGPVTAVLWYAATPDGSAVEPIEITDPAWCIVGYPRFAPQLPDLVTLDDLIYDLSVRDFGYAPYLYGVPPYGPLGFNPEDLGTSQQADQALAKWRQQTKTYNENYYPYWDTDLYPILSRPYLYQTFTTITIQNDPHETGPGSHGNFDMAIISKPPAHPNDPANDPGWGPRNYIYGVLRQPGQENVYEKVVPQPSPMQALKLPLMPLLNGDNPLTNEVVSKFFNLTPTQLFFLKQWACGKFIAGVMPTDDPCKKPVGPPPPPYGTQLDRGVLGNGLGGAFCPGAEVTWFIRTPDIYVKPYRIRQSPWTINIGDTRQLNLNWYGENALNSGTKENFLVGLQAGDVTKRNAIPWQADFNECTTNDTDVTYQQWNVIGKKNSRDVATGVIWWPAHRFLQVNTQPKPPAAPSIGPPLAMVQWAWGIPQDHAGDFKMVTAWKTLGFLRNVNTVNPVTIPWFVLQEAQNQTQPQPPSGS
jgi:hypothetical protein